jgi:Methyltransferase domain
MATLRSGQGSSIRRRRLWESRAAVRAYRALRTVAERFGLQIVLKTYYSPIPDLALLPESTWETASAMAGVAFDLDAQAAFLLEQLAPELSAFEPTGTPGHAYETGNASYPLPDARLLYAMIRFLRPSRVVELGSGQTTRVIAKACLDNARDGRATTLKAFDPFPTAVDESLPGLNDLIRSPAQLIPGDIFAELEAGDVLFVDTTHTVKIGSDVNHIILNVLPLLAPGVIVHFHDVCLPYEYPRYLFTDYALYWSEQYLLQAFLIMNSSFEVLVATNALCRDRPDTAAKSGLAQPGQSGSSFWIRHKPSQ